MHHSHDFIQNSAKRKDSFGRALDRGLKGCLKEAHSLMLSVVSEKTIFFIIF